MTRYHFQSKQNAFADEKAKNQKLPISMLLRLVSLAFLLICVAFLPVGCNKHGDKCRGLDESQEFAASCSGLQQQTRCELQQAREATQKYRDINVAIKDGYADISVVLPNMGYHYMRSTIVDAAFEITKPEILVYNKTHEGDFELVAVEYAVPIDISPNTAPQGFTGNTDVWDHNTGFGLWLLHAWVFKPNDAGVFNPTNPGVHVH